MTAVIKKRKENRMAVIKRTHRFSV